MEIDKSTPKNKSILKKQVTAAPTVNQANRDQSPLEREQKQNQHEINPDTGFSAAVTAKITKEYESIADIDDVEVNIWQRQLRVNKFMVDLEVRKMVSTMLEPVYKQHEEI
jgi:hypothetical protein